MSTYYYLISSLPAISLWEKPEITLDIFIENCSQWLNPKEIELLKKVDISPNTEVKGHLKTLVMWNNWETCLRNRLSKHRSSKLDLDNTPYVRDENDYFSEIERIAQEAVAADNPLEKEKYLDEQRWNYLNNLEAGHMFDLEIICIYKLKLMLCEKWLNRKTENGKENFDKALDELYKKDMLEIN